MIVVSVSASGFRPDRRLLRRCEKAVTASERRLVRRRAPSPLCVCVNFIPGSAMRRLNRYATGRRGDTDVLSFNFDEPRGRYFFLGEIYISVGRLKRQASEYRQSLKAEAALLFIHGFLHLLGYDHEKGGKHRRLMEAKQSACFQSVFPLLSGVRP